MKIFLRYFLLPAVTLLVGISIGLVIRDIPKFSMDYNIKITDVFSIILTFGIGVFIPLLVKKLIDDKRTKNAHLFEELSGFSKMTENIHDYIQDVYNNKKILVKDKDYINIQMDLLGKEFNEFHAFMMDNCPKQTTDYLNELKTCYIEYWQISTSIEVIGSSIKKIDDKTFKKICEKYTEMNKRIRRIKTEIIKH
jgi:archaellum component FlaC